MVGHGHCLPHTSPQALCPAVPGDILRVLNREETAGCATLDVGDVIVKDLGARRG